MDALVEVPEKQFRGGGGYILYATLASLHLWRLR